MPGILNSIEVHIQRSHVPFKRLIFADINVIAHDRALLAGTAEPEVYRRLRANAREIHGGVSCAGDPIYAGVQRFIENNTDARAGAGRGKAHQEENQNNRNGSSTAHTSGQESSPGTFASIAHESTHSKFSVSLKDLEANSRHPPGRSGPSPERPLGWCSAVSATYPEVACRLLAPVSAAFGLLSVGALAPFASADRVCDSAAPVVAVDAAGVAPAVVDRPSVVPVFAPPGRAAVALSGAPHPAAGVAFPFLSGASAPVRD